MSLRPVEAYRVAGIYGLGHTIYTPFLKKCATIYGLNTAFALKNVIFDLQHVYVHDLSHQDLSMISVRDVKK